MPLYFALLKGLRLITLNGWDSVCVILQTEKISMYSAKPRPPPPPTRSIKRIRKKKKEGKKKKRRQEEEKS